MSHLNRHFFTHKAMFWLIIEDAFKQTEAKPGILWVLVPLLKNAKKPCKGRNLYASSPTNQSLAHLTKPHINLLSAYIPAKGNNNKNLGEGD